MPAGRVLKSRPAHWSGMLHRQLEAAAVTVTGRPSCRTNISPAGQICQTLPTVGNTQQPASDKYQKTLKIEACFFVRLRSLRCPSPARSSALQFSPVRPTTLDFLALAREWTLVKKTLVTSNTTELFIDDALPSWRRIPAGPPAWGGVSGEITTVFVFVFYLFLYFYLYFNSCLGRSF